MHQASREVLLKTQLRDQQHVYKTLVWLPEGHVKGEGQKAKDSLSLIPCSRDMELRFLKVYWKLFAKVLGTVHKKNKQKQK